MDKTNNLKERLSSSKHEELSQIILEKGVQWYKPEDHYEFSNVDGFVSEGVPDELITKIESLRDEGKIETSDRNERGKCYSNAFYIAQNTDCVYVEGFALIKSKPIHHAWNCFDGELIDATADFSEYRGLIYDDGCWDAFPMTDEENWGIQTDEYSVNF